MVDVSPVGVFAVAVRLENFRSEPGHCLASPWRGEVVHYTLFMVPIMRVEVTCGGEGYSYRAGLPARERGGRGADGMEGGHQRR